MGKISFIRGDLTRDFPFLIMCVVIILASFSVRSIDSQTSACADLVKTYFECRFLTMTNSSETDFTPDENIEGNSLTDAFLISQRVDRMTLQQAIQLYGRIYRESNCRTYRCDCIRSKLNVDGNDYSLFFNSAGALRGLEFMISQLDRDNSVTKKPQDELDAYYASYNLPSLTSFCSISEFSSLRESFYSNWGSCIINTPYELFEKWQHASYYFNNKANFTIAHMNQVQLQNYMISNRLNYRNCSIPVQRFEMMQYWVEDLSNLKWSGSNSASFFDILARRSRGKPPIDYNITQVYTYDTPVIEVTNFKGQSFEIDPDDEIRTMQICFRTRLLQIDCLIQWNDDWGGYLVDRIVVTFFFPENRTAPNSFLSYTFSYEAIEGAGPDDSNDDGYYERTPSNRANLFYTYIYEDEFDDIWMVLNDFRTDTYFYFSYYNLYLLGTPSFIKDATGFLIDGQLR